MVSIQPRYGAVVGSSKNDGGEAPGLETEDARNGDVILWGWRRKAPGQIERL
jgi:hypothetical protein